MKLVNKSPRLPGRSKNRASYQEIAPTIKRVKIKTKPKEGLGSDDYGYLEGGLVLE